MGPNWSPHLGPFAPRPSPLPWGPKEPWFPFCPGAPIPGIPPWPFPLALEVKPGPWFPSNSPPWPSLARAKSPSNPRPCLPNFPTLLTQSDQCLGILTHTVLWQRSSLLPLCASVRKRTGNYVWFPGKTALLILNSLRNCAAILRQRLTIKNSAAIFPRLYGAQSAGRKTAQKTICRHLTSIRNQ